MKHLVSASLASCIAMSICLVGCDDEKHLVETAERLVEADAKAREDAMAMQRELHEEAAEIGRQRDQLEVERQEIAEERLTESVVGPAISNAAPLLACGLALLLCHFLIYGLRSAPGEDDVVADVLVDELVSDRPALAPPDSRRAIDLCQSPSTAIPDETGKETELRLHHEEKGERS